MPAGDHRNAEANLIARIEDLLEAQRVAIDETVSTYPGPIPACDVQFNHTLDQQAAIRREIRRAAELFEDVLGREDFAGVVAGFISSSVFINGATEHELQTSLEALGAESRRPT